MVEGLRELSGVSFIKTLISLMGAPPLWLNPVLSALLPDTITLGAWFHHVYFGGGMQTFHNIRDVVKHPILHRTIMQPQMLVAIPFSGASSQPRDRTWVFRIAGRFFTIWATRASQVALVVRNLPANAGNIRDTGSIPGLGRSLEGGHSNPLQHSCLESPMDRGA